MKQAVDDLDNSTISILGLFLRIPISKNKYLTPHSHTHEPFFSTPTQAELPACKSLHPIQNQSKFLALALCVYLYVHSILYMHIASALGRESESVRMRVCARPLPMAHPHPHPYPDPCPCSPRRVVVCDPPWSFAQERVERSLVRFGSGGLGIDWRLVKGLNWSTAPSK